MNDEQTEYIIYLLESILKTSLYKLETKDLNSDQRKEVRGMERKLNE